MVQIEKGGPWLIKEEVLVNFKSHAYTHLYLDGVEQIQRVEGSNTVKINIQNFIEEEKKQLESIKREKK